MAWVLSVGELAQAPHYPETRASLGGYLHRTGSLGLGISRVDMPTHPAAAMRAAVATGASG